MRRLTDDGFVCGMCLETIYLGECKCEPIEDVLHCDPFQQLLEDGHRMQGRLRSSRDTRSIMASNSNTAMLMEAIRGKLK